MAIIKSCKSSHRVILQPEKEKTMSSINSIGGGGIQMTSGMNRPDPAKFVDNLFTKLDTTNKGYLEKSDLQSALNQIHGSGSSSSSSNTSASVDEIFKKLDGNSDGKITRDEMSSGMKKLADALDSQFNQMRMKGSPGGGKGGPPPVQPGTSGTSSSQASSAEKTYDPADANHDGKVSLQENIAYELANLSSAPTSSDTDNTASSTSTNSDAQVMKQIIELMQAYSSFDSGSNNPSLSAIA